MPARVGGGGRVRAARRRALRRQRADGGLLADDRTGRGGAFSRAAGPRGRSDNVARVSRSVLVTGGAGFIGSNLVRALLERGDTVRVLDNFSTGNRANLAGLEDDVEVVEGELRSYERVHNAVRGVELVFHQGALPSVPRSVQDPLTTSAVTIEGTLNVLLAARDEDVRRVVYASSSSVYGNSGDAASHRDAAARPDLALRGREARRGALLRQLRPRLRARDGRAALLQRLRAAPGPELAVRRRRAALHRRDRRGRAGADPRRRHPVARLHLRRQRRRGEPARRRAGTASAARC